MLANFSGLQATGTPTQFHVRGEPIPLNSEAQLALYRTAQEALTNVRKHAQATSVNVRLRYAADGAELVGGSLEAGPRPSGYRVRPGLPMS